MSQIPDIHLDILQPAGSVHWLGLLDQARYFRYQFRRLGAQVTMAKSRMRHDAINFVFGAHDGYDPTPAARYACVYVNLEQLGADGQQVPQSYLKLLSSSAVVDYDPANVRAYAADPGDVPLAPILYAPYLSQADMIPLEERPIDLLFIGCMNERRRAWLDRIEATGRSVSLFDAPLFGADRDHYIRQAKAVVNAHFYDSCRFEQARVSHCLSLGTPVISERAATTRPHDGFEDSVFWLQGQELEQFFSDDFGTPAYFDAARGALARFQATDPAADYADVLAFAQGYAGERRKQLGTAPWQPTRVHLGAGRDYRAGWLNLDLDAQQQPDGVLGAVQPLATPLSLTSPLAGPVLLQPGSVDTVQIGAVLSRVDDLAALLNNTLALLRNGGELCVDLPLVGTPSAWQHPSARRVSTEDFVYHCTEGFWQLGWFEHRFDLRESSFVDTFHRPCAQAHAAFMRVALCKVETTPQERMLAQTMQIEVRLPDDALDAPVALPAIDAAPTTQRPVGPATASFAAPVARVPSAAATPPQRPLPGSALQALWRDDLAA